MFGRIEHEERRWYIAFSGSSLQNVLVAVEAGLGLSLLPRSAVSGYRLRQYAPFGTEPPMVVSIYAWESTGPVSGLMERMEAVLDARRALLEADE